MATLNSTRCRTGSQCRWRLQLVRCGSNGRMSVASQNSIRWLVVMFSLKYRWQVNILRAGPTTEVPFLRLKSIQQIRRSSEIRPFSPPEHYTRSGGDGLWLAGALTPVAQVCKTCSVRRPFAVGSPDKPCVGKRSRAGSCSYWAPSLESDCGPINVLCCLGTGQRLQNSLERIVTGTRSAWQNF